MMKFWIFCSFLLVACNSLQVFNNSINDHAMKNKERTKILSRRKRFLTFPDGSSFQLVFCVQSPGLISIGNIFLYGSTAALAWNLPTDPQFFHLFKDSKQVSQRRQDIKHYIYYTNEKGDIIAKVPYKRKPIVNPAFAKRSVDSTEKQFKKRTLENFQIDRKQMHASKHKREFLYSEHMEGLSVEFQRSSRATLYQKIEALFQAHGNNGKQCVLKTLCLVGQTQHYRQGTFLQEIVRAVFTLPESKPKLPSGAQVDLYDEAFTAQKPCDLLYPECQDTSTEMVTISPSQ